MVPMLTLVIASLVGLIALGVLLPIGARRGVPLLERPGARWAVFALALALGAVLDLASKSYAFGHLPDPGDTVALTSWFSFTHARNLGAAFGMFQGQHTFFMVVTVAALVGVPYFVHAARARVIATAAVMGLILSGVIGNFWDRMVFGYVRDFLDVHTPPAGALHDFFMGTVGRTVWPTFNVADVFITCGAVVVVILLSREEDGEAAEAPAPAEAAPQAAAPEAPAPDEAAAPAQAAAAEERA